MAKVETLICLKAKAFLDLKRRKERGENIDSKKVVKHKNDIIRLAVLLSEESTIVLPDSISTDIGKFIEIIEKEPPDFRMLGKNMETSSLKGENILKQIKSTFSV